MASFRNIYLGKILESHWCQLVFLIALAGGYFLIPQTAMSGGNLILAIAFLILFALVATCLVRNIKEKVLLARGHRIGILGILAIIFGFSALQMCAMNAMCLAGAGAGILGVIFPGIMLNFLEKYAVIILLFSIITEVLTLYFMNCFRRCFKKILTREKNY